MAGLTTPPGLPMRQALVAAIGAVLVQLAGSRLLLRLAGGDGSLLADPSGFVLAFLVVPALLSLAWIWFVAVWREPDGWRRIGFTGQPRASLGLGLLAGAGSVLLSMTVVALLTPLLGEPQGPPLPVPLPVALGRPGFAVLFAVAAIVLAPLAEEALFRGVLYGWLRRRLSPVQAGLAAALSHALLHGDPAATPALTAVFLVYVWSYERSGSLWVPVIAHSLHNGTILLLALAATSG